jgi:hypothetical protein
MEPPLPTPNAAEVADPVSDINSSSLPSTVNPQSTPLTKHRPKMAPSEQLAGKRMYSSSHGQDVPPNSTLGQFSFGPATQTTIVTTTTTTTTSFPPIVMPPPRSMSGLDPKLYPLASTPTPSSIKKLSFMFGGNQTFFQEAEDTSRALDQVNALLLIR